MKICPLITQTSILDDKELLFRELDDVGLAKDKKQEGAAVDEDGIFINPTPKPHGEKTLLEEIAPAVPVRFLAKSFRGDVECLGELCRFHNGEANACRIDLMLVHASSDPRHDEAVSADVRSELAKSWELQQKSADEILSLFKELEAKNDSRVSEFTRALEEKLEELKGFMRSAEDEKQKTIEAISLTLDAKTEEIERKIDSGEEQFQSFRDEIASWKGVLSNNLEGIETELGEHRKLVQELSDNHSGIMQLVESQKKSIEKEEKQRHVSEARRLNNAGVMAYHNGQYEKALELFRKALDLDPAMTEAYNNLGLTYTEINEEEKATEAFKKAIELGPELAAAYNNLGYLFYRLGSYEEAIEMYNEAIGRSTDNSSAYTNLGNAYYKLDKIEEAMDAWKKALAIDPANEKARRNLKRFHAEVK
jgi:tetratricopeptide (TPR) repeat protein